MRRIGLLVCLIGLVVMRVQAQESKEAVAQTIYAFFDAIAAHDSTALVGLMIPEAQAIALSEQEGTVQYRWRKGTDDASMLANTDAAFLERMWEPEIRVDGPLASVWTRYDFYVDKVFSHCGTDAFQLIRVGEAWKMVSVVYTTERDPAKCPASPLGDPTF